MIADLAGQILKISMLTSPIIGLLLLLVPVLQKRYSVKWRYVIWIIIAVRMLIPFNLTLPQVPVKIELPENATRIMLQSIVMPQAEIWTEPEINSMLSYEATLLSMGQKNISLTQIIGFIWLVGVLIFLLFQIFSYQIFLRRLKRFKKENVPVYIKEAIWQLGVDMGISISGLPEPVITDVIDAPVLIGMLRPRILLPHTKYSAEDIAFILRHELIHYLRKDMWYKLVLMLANALHWFNPLLYLMTVQAARDIELVCDDDVTREFDRDTRAKYGNTILTAMPGKRRSKPMFSTNFGSSKRNIKSRLHNLFDMSAKRRGIAAFCAVVLCAALIASTVTFSYAAVKNDSLPMIEGEFTYSIPSIEIGKVVCIGKIELSPNISYTSTLSVESGSGVMIALNKSPDVTTLNGTVWNQYYGSGSGSTATFSSELKQTYYVYVGSHRNPLFKEGPLSQGTKLTNVTGKIVASGRIADEAVSNDDNIYFSERDKEGIRIMENSGSWGESINRLLPLMTQAGVERIVDIYLEKHLFPRITTPQSASQVAHTIEPALKYMSEETKKTVNNKIDVYLTVSTAAPKEEAVFRITNNGGKNVIQSGSFQAEAGQILTITVQSDINGGKVDLFLFSSSGQEQRFTLSGSATTTTVELSTGTWAYNCTGFFDSSGNITVTGKVS